MGYRRCGASGLLLPEVSLGFWHNFGSDDDYDVCKAIVHYAFDHGVTYFDLANNYGPPYGSAEETFGRIYTESLRSHRDELIIASKAGHDMWPGPYGEWSSRRTARIKEIMLPYGFSVVYDRDQDEPVSDGLFFTIGYRGMEGGELLRELLYYGITGIVLSTTGSTRQGIRACCSNMLEHHYPLLADRCRLFAADHP
jgi:hypothetical protein